MVSVVTGQRGKPVPSERDLEESEDSDSGSESPVAPSGQHRHCAKAAAYGVVLLGVAALAVWAAQAALTQAALMLSSAGHARMRELSGNGGVFDEAATKLGKDLFNTNEQGLFDVDDRVSDNASVGGGEEAVFVPNAPTEDMHDGNVCDDDEELLANLCYKKCSLITHGKYPRRTTAWSCCSAGDQGEKCGLFNQKLRAGICTGYDISGDRAGNGCPHPAGACLENEEVHLGRCFKKCSELTDGEYPSRLAAATCCKAEVEEEWKCLDIRNVKTRQSFNVGGGKGDGDSRTPPGPHWPKTAWTESKN